MEYARVYRLASKAVKMGLLRKSRGRNSKYELTSLGRLYLSYLRSRLLRYLGLNPSQTSCPTYTYV